MVSKRVKVKGWKYKRNQIVHLKGTKGSGLKMRHVINRVDVPWEEITGKITDLIGTHKRPEYAVMITPRWHHFFSYKGISLLEEDIYLKGENPNIQYLDEGLFEL